ncbi:endolytic transglycosylase MltG [Alkalihalobacterium elongatum]|uniref:endolytic transglycosylase MltG n=1 Tax=Alkalihalobacterium elongatum TaxID=2675466 RepID=UPI001C1F5BA6|nr:endolytic transglycosylase MltG [Alkalihalobacterium elongatum]
MDKHTARGLSIGFLITGIVLLVFKSILTPAHTTAEEPVLTKESIEMFLRENNLMVVSQADFETMISSEAEVALVDEEPAKEKKESSKADEKVEEEKQEESKEEEKEEKQEEKKEEEKKEEKPKKHKITIKSGMVSYDVAKVLKDKKLIKSESRFVNRVESRNAANYIQIGEHELESGMTMDEIIQVITKGRAG